MNKFFNLRQLKLFWLIVVEGVKRNKIVLVGGLIIAAVVVLSQLRFHLFYNPNRISLGFIGTYQDYDLPTEVTGLISQSLVEVDDKGHDVGKLVSGWEINNDATSFKFKLKDHLKWNDGTLLKAQDLDFSIPNTEVSYPDDKTIGFKLKESYSPLPSLLTRPVLKKGTMIGTGPYKIKSIDRSIIFITKITLLPIDPAMPEIVIRFYPNEKVAMTGFNLGEVSALFGFSSPKAFNNESDVSLKQKTDHTKIVSILFQTKDSMLSNRSLRQALAYAAPKIAGEELADNPYPHNFWAYNPDSKQYLSDPSDAKAALERAKASIPDDKLKAELILTATPNLEGVGNQVVKTWQDLGFNAKLRVESGIAQNFQALLITQSIPADPDQYVLWHATQEKTNLTKYDSKRADKDLEDGRKVTSEEARKDKYFDFQKVLLEDAPAIFLYFPKYNIAYLKKSEGLLNKILPLAGFH